MMNYEEILMMMITEPFVSVDATPIHTTIKSIHNSQTHVDMITFEIKKWAKEHGVKIEVETGATPLFDELLNENGDIIKLYNEDGYIQIRIELFYH